MRFGGWIGALIVFLTLGSSAVAPAARENPKPLTGDVLIGRRIYFDFGPPFDFYEIFRIEPGIDDLHIERLRLTPGGHICIRPALLEVTSARISGSMLDLFGGASPCAIPEKELRRESKRCKRCLSFSGADVMIEVRCGDQTRRIPMAILDRDLFDRPSKPPKHTSWTMALLDRLDRTLGDVAMDKPAFVATGHNDAQSGAGERSSKSLIPLSQGAFDQLFPGAPDKPSAIYAETHKPPVRPSVNWTEDTPISSTVSLPTYPPIARAAHIQGQVSVSLYVDSTGSASNVAITAGHPLLKPAVEAQARTWKFPSEMAG